MKLGSFAVVDAREPSELQTGYHQIAKTYNTMSEAMQSVEEYLQKHPERSYVVVEAVAQARASWKPVSWSYSLGQFGFGSAGF